MKTTPFETLVHDHIEFKFKRNSFRNVRIILSDVSIEQVYERAIKLGYTPIKWYQFWRSYSTMYIKHNGVEKIWKCNK